MSTFKTPSREPEGGTARIISAAGEGTEGDEPANVLMRRIVDAFAEYERLIPRASTRAALAAKGRRGERIGQVPLGRQLAADGRALLPDPAELGTLAEIRRLRAAGTSLRGIARALTERGIPTKNRAAAWSHRAVAKILRRTDDHGASREGGPAGAAARSGAGGNGRGPPGKGMGVEGWGARRRGADDERAGHQSARNGTLPEAIRRGGLPTRASLLCSVFSVRAVACARPREPAAGGNLQGAATPRRRGESARPREPAAGGNGPT